MERAGKSSKNNISDFVLDIERSLIGIDPRQKMKLASLDTWSNINDLEKSIASLDETLDAIGKLRDHYQDPGA